MRGWWSRLLAAQLCLRNSRNKPGVEPAAHIKFVPAAHIKFEPAVHIEFVPAAHNKFEKYLGLVLTRIIELVYDCGMTTSRRQRSESGTHMPDSQVRSRFESIVADLLWHHSPKTESPAELLGRLLAFPPGIELMSELRAIDANELATDQRLIYAHLWERCVGWVTDQAAAGAAGFIDAITDPPEHRMVTRAGVDIADEVSLDEVAITTGLSTAKAAWRVLTGRALAPAGPLAATGVALRAGRISFDVASAFVDATSMLSPEHATAVQNRVLPRAINVIHPGTGAGCWRTRAWAIRELRRAVIAVDPDTVIKRREQAHRRRSVSLSFDHTAGMAWLTAYLPAHEAMELHDTLNALAAHMRSADTAADPDTRPRGWDAARADALVEAVRAAGDTLTHTGSLPSVHGHTRINVNVVVDLPTLLNLADHPGEILGYGPIDPDYARLLAAQADIWRRWVLEPVTGHLLDYGRTRYKPTQELRDYILAAYPECTKPECNRHNPRFEIDHAVEWHDDGPTSAANLQAMCWQDHLAKTNKHTRVHMNADGTVTHTTRHGLTRTNEPYWRSYSDNLTGGRATTSTTASTSTSTNEHADDPPPF